MTVSRMNHLKSLRMMAMT